MKSTITKLVMAGLMGITFAAQAAPVASFWAAPMHHHHHHHHNHHHHGHHFGHHFGHHDGRR